MKNIEEIKKTTGMQLKMEGQARKKLFEKYPPKYVYINSTRQMCAMNGEFEKYNATAIYYCWFVWEKGYEGEPVIRWI